MLDKKATMLLPLERCVKLAENPVLLAQDESHTCFGHLAKESAATASSHILSLILDFQGMKNKGCLRPPRRLQPQQLEQLLCHLLSPGSQGLSHHPKAGLRLLLLGLKAYFGHSAASLKN